MIFGVTLTSCNVQENKENNKNETQEDAGLSWGRKSAMLETDDGWFYVFYHNFNKDSQVDNGLIPYQFFGVNLKYRYHEDYVTTIQYESNGQLVEKEVPAVIQILGESNSTAIKLDMDEIADVLKYSGGEITNEELLSLTTDDLTFEELDEKMFLDLIREALTGEPHKEGKYGYLPGYALLEEKQYLNGYKFQIGFIVTVGCLDAVVIDVLYQTGSGYDEYVQLSDMVASGTATQEQIELYQFIENIENGMLENNDCLYLSSIDSVAYEFSNIDISRLNLFLENIEQGAYSDYIKYPG